MGEVRIRMEKEGWKGIPPSSLSLPIYSPIFPNWIVHCNKIVSLSDPGTVCNMATSGLHKIDEFMEALRTNCTTELAECTEISRIGTRVQKRCKVERKDKAANLCNYFDHFVDILPPPLPPCVIPATCEYCITCLWCDSICDCKHIGRHIGSVSIKPSDHIVSKGIRGHAVNVCEETLFEKFRSPLLICKLNASITDLGRFLSFCSTFFPTFDL